MKLSDIVTLKQHYALFCWESGKEAVLSFTLAFAWMNRGNPDYESCGLSRRHLIPVTQNEGKNFLK